MFLTNNHAEANKSIAGKKYTPSNGMEGGLFYHCYCASCVKDEEFRQTGFNSCEILRNTMMHNVKDEEYPVQWVYGDDGQPVCTAHEKMADVQD